MTSSRSNPSRWTMTCTSKARFSVDLYVSSSAPDTAFTAKLMCVDPDGTARNYRTSITTIGLDTPDAAPYKPGEIRRVSIDMWGICWMVPAGSRIRCDISSSDFPQYSVHTNHAGLWSEQTGTQVPCEYPLSPYYSKSSAHQSQPIPFLLHKYRHNTSPVPDVPEPALPSFQGHGTFP